MAVRRPLYYKDHELREMTDLDMAYIRYLTRKKFAAQLSVANTSAPEQTFVYSGSSPGTDWTEISDVTVTTVVYKGYDLENPYPGNYAYPANNGPIFANTNIDYTYYQYSNSSVVTLPNNSVMNTYSYLVYDQSNNSLITESILDNVRDTFINLTIEEMKGVANTSNGINDTIGTFVVSTSQPGNNYVIIQSDFYVDYEFSDMENEFYAQYNNLYSFEADNAHFTTSFNLYIKVDDEFQKGIDEKYMLTFSDNIGVSNESGIIEKPFDQFDNMVDDLLLPLLKYELSNNFTYKLQNTIMSEEGRNKGSLIRSYSRDQFNTYSIIPQDYDIAYWFYNSWHSTDNYIIYYFNIEDL